jgi:hypothetical protein
MIPDLNLELKTGWSTVVSKGVGANPPALYGIKQYLGKLGLFTQGIKGQYCDWLAAIHRPIPVANPTGLAMEFIFSFSFTTAIFCQCLEFDGILTRQLKKFNCSFQINIAEGWQLQISAQDGSWIGIGVQVAPLAPDTDHTACMIYKYDTVKDVYSFISITIDGVTYAIPSKFQNLAAIVTNWSDTFSVQLQHDANALGGSFSASVRSLNLFWEE